MGASGDNREQAAVQRAAALRRASRVDEALRALDEAEAAIGVSASLRCERSRCLENRGAIDDAITAAREATTLEPQTASYAVRLARVLFKRARYREALASATRALELAPTNIAALQCQGDAAFSARDRETARAAYSRLVALEPDKVLWKVYHARTLRGDDALAALQALPRDADLPMEVLNNIALGLRDAGDATAAVEVARLGVARWPERVEPLSVLASALSKCGRHDEALDAALDAARKLLDLAEHSPRPEFRFPGLMASEYELLARLALAAGRTEVAITAAEKARDLGPVDATTLTFLAEHFVAFGREQEALELVKRALVERPTSKKASRLHAKLIARDPNVRH